MADLLLISFLALMVTSTLFIGGLGTIFVIEWIREHLERKKK